MQSISHVGHCYGYCFVLFLSIVPVKPRIDVKAGLNLKPSSVTASANKISPAVVSSVASSAIVCPKATAESSKALQVEETSCSSEAPQELGEILVEAEPQPNNENFSEKICDNRQSDMKESSFSDDDCEFDDDDDEDWNDDDYNTCDNEVL